VRDEKKKKSRKHTSFRLYPSPELYCTEQTQTGLTPSFQRHPLSGVTTIQGAGHTHIIPLGERDGLFERSTVAVPGRRGTRRDLGGLTGKRIWKAPTIPGAGQRSKSACFSSRYTCVDHVVSPSSCGKSGWLIALRNRLGPGYPDSYTTSKSQELNAMPDWLAGG